ncbi:hypothetical protein LOZ58_001726 [Ophidiomyces ophidiicola]|nr:hypothetical protein LOZ58_001726 [Ophidiomyces ophidiicola]
MPTVKQTRSNSVIAQYADDGNDVAEWNSPQEKVSLNDTGLKVFVTSEMVNPVRSCLTAMTSKVRMQKKKKRK